MHVSIVWWHFNFVRYMLMHLEIFQIFPFSRHFVRVAWLGLLALAFRHCVYFPCPHYFVTFKMGKLICKTLQFSSSYSEFLRAKLTCTSFIAIWIKMLWRHFKKRLHGIMKKKLFESLFACIIFISFLAFALSVEFRSRTFVCSRKILNYAPWRELRWKIDNSVDFSLTRPQKPPLMYR